MRFMIADLAVIMVVRIVMMVMVMFMLELFQRAGRDWRESLAELDRLAMLSVEIGATPMFLIVGNFRVRRHATAGHDLFKRLHPL